MDRNILRLLSLLLCSLAFAAICADDALLLHWRLDEGDGVLIADSSPRKLDGRIANPESVKWVEGRDGGKALEFIPGQNGKHPFVYVEVKDKELFSKGLTLSVWVKLNPADYARGSIWTIAASGRGARGFNMVLHYERLLLGGDGSKLTKYAASNNSKTPIKGGVWTHFAATHDGKDQFKVYIDGVLAGIANGEKGGPVTQGIGALSLGSQFGYGGFHGVFSDFRIYGRAMGDAEIMELSLQTE